MTSSTIAAVLGVGGSQNQAIAVRMAESGFRVRGVGRSAHAPASLALDMDYRGADVENVASIEKAIAGADVVVFTSPIDHRAGVRERFVERVLLAAGRASVRRLVFNAAAAVYDDRNHPVAKVLGALSDAVLDGPAPAVVLQPTVYMDNLLAPWALPVIRDEGQLLYPMPENAPVSWISHRSLADFVCAAAVRDVAGRVFRIGGPEALTGKEIAARLSDALGRQVQYTRIAPSILAEGLNGAYGAPAGDDIAALYTTMADQPDIMRRDPNDWADLRVVPETFKTWASRQAWIA